LLPTLTIVVPAGGVGQEPTTTGAGSVGAGNGAGSVGAGAGSVGAGSVVLAHETTPFTMVKPEQFGSEKEKLAAWPTPARSRKGAEAAKAINGFIDQVLDQG